jgi:hypothetical protein
MSYFNHPYASNSELKEIVSRSEGRQKPENIQQIYDFGSGFHAGILEPHKADFTNVSPENQELIKEMSATFWRDKLCREFAMAPDFKREHEYYRKERFGISAKCKVDGQSKKLGVILELKGLSVTTQKAFEEGIYHLCYDQGAAWYLNVASEYQSMTFRSKFFVGISKNRPDRLFKLLVDRDHAVYKSGLQKVRKAVNIWKIYGFN